MRSTETGVTAGVLPRGLVLASVGVLVSLLGHGFGHGTAPDAAALVVVSVLSLAAGLALARSRWSPLRLVLALTVVQVLVHGAGWMTSSSGSSVDPRLAALASPSTTVHDHATATTPRMLVAHAVAVLVSALLVAAVEQAWTVVVAAGRLARPAGRLVLPVRSVLRWHRSRVVVLGAPHLSVVRSQAPPAPLGA